MTPRHIGIVACSAEGAALCYRTICVEGAASARHAWPSRGHGAHAFAGRLHGLHRSRGLAGRGRADARLREQADSGRRGFPDLPRQHHPSGATATSHSARRSPGCTSPSGRGEAMGARLQTPLDPGHAMAGRQPGLSECANGAGLAYMRPDAEERDEINRIIMDELVCGVFRPRRSRVSSVFSIA